jgi:hypothetical protein
MPEIRGFSFNQGIAGVLDSVSEIARKNLPDSAQVVPGGELTRAQVYGKLSHSAMQEAFDRFIEPDIKNRELQIPEVFAAVIDRIMNKINSAESPSAKQQAMNECLQELSRDKQLCDMLRSLLISG